MNKVVFFNHWHNGDIHISRGIVKLIINKVHQIDPAIVFEYSHRNAPSLLADISNLGFNSVDVNQLDPHSGVTFIGETVYINTWYDQQYQKFAKQWGILTLDALFAAFDEACLKIWGFSLQDTSDNIEDYFPSIDYSKFEISAVTRWLQDHPETKILVESGQALSGQAHNFPIAPFIIELSKQHLDKTFILSQRENYELPSNVITTYDIIKKSDTDLNEISFLSTHCDMIIGKASAIFTFSLTKENLFSRPTKMLCFSRNIKAAPNRFWVGGLLQNVIEYSATVITSNESDPNNIKSIIQNYVKEII